MFKDAMKAHTRSAVLLIAVLFGAALVYWGLMHPFVTSTSSRTSDWREEIASLGGAAAYEELVQFNARLSAEEQHTQAHLFGGALYEAEGLKGLPVCDQRFSYGCYHEFLGKAVSELGLGSVGDLADACTKALTTSPFSCLHGLGHGILASIGYDRSHLSAALAACDALKNGSVFGGCTGGVFMEFNMRTMLGGHDIRSSDDSYEPCDSIESRYVEACVFALPQWWSNAALKKMQSDEKFIRMGTLCTNAPQASHRACFEGLGIVAAAEADFEASSAVGFCAAASMGDRDMSLYCLSFAANTIFSTSQNQASAELVCKDLRGSDAGYCLSYARNEANILHRIPIPTAKTI